MYLTKIKLHPQIRAVQDAFADCQKLHQKVTAFFESSRKESNILYRVRTDKGQNSIYLYSDIPPIQQKIPGMEVCATQDLTSWVQKMQQGQVLSFDIVCIPAKKVKTQNTKNSQRRLLKTLEERTAWMYQKAHQFGFEILSLQEFESVRQVGYKKQQNTMYLDGYHYQGVLRITNIELFIAALHCGIGAGKAYGFGMLLLR